MERYALEAPGSTFKTLEEHNSLSMMMHERYRSGRTVAERLQYWLSWQKTRRYERALFGRFDLVTLVSEPDRTYSEQYVHGSDVRVSVIPNGVDCEWNSTGEAPVTGCSLIYSGAMTYGANYDAVQYFLKEIYPVVKAGVPDVIFRVTGSTNGVRLEDLNLDQSVELTGHVEDIRSVVAGATGCVIPLREGGGTRLKILEAMALGTPVVSTSKGAEGLNVVAGEHLLIADDAASFAREIGRLLGDEAMRERLARNGRKLVEAQYDWRKIGREYSDLVERAVLAKKGS
jgi:glycosyltransferase involved in cell wall biosynthesis